MTCRCLRWAFRLSHWEPENAGEWLMAIQAVQPEERARILRFHFREDVKSALIGRLMLRQAALKILRKNGMEISWKEVEFGRTERGKPFVMYPETSEKLSLNISHHEDFVVLASSCSKYCGVDTMKIEIEPMSDAAKMYRIQLRCAMETVRNGGKTISKDVIRLTEEIGCQWRTMAETEERKRISSQLSQALPNMTALEKAEYHEVLLETYLWTAVCLLGMSCGRFLATYFLRYVLGVFFNTWVTILLAYLLVPFWFILKDFTWNKTEDERQMILFGVAVVLGVLSGHNVADLRISFSSPPAFVLPLSSALTAGMIGPTVAKDRGVYLGASLGVAVFVYLIFGLISSSLHFTYLIWTMVIIAVEAVDLQVQLGKIQEGTFNVILAQFSTVVTSVICYAVLMRLFGTHRSKQEA